MRQSLFLLAAMMIGLTCRTAPAASPPKINDAADEKIVESFCAHARSETAKLTDDKLKETKEPEMYCWIALKFMNLSLTAYELTGEESHLDDFGQAYGNLHSLLTKGEDGYLGWYGVAVKDNQNADNPEAVIDDIQTSFRAVAVVSRWLKLLEREPKLNAKYEKQRHEYLDVMKNHLVAKWHARGSYEDFGDRGAVYRSNPKYRRGDITLPYEKLSIMVDGLLNLYLASGDDVYLQRAVKIGTRLKRCLMLEDGRYRWHYWDPAGKWDAKPDEDKWKHWMGPEPRGGWHDVTVGIMTRLYQLGLVFDKTDIGRLVKTQNEVCWNGSETEPVYKCTNGKPPQGKQQMTAYGLTPFNAKFAAFMFTGALQDLRLSKKDSPWQGGVLADDYLRYKYLIAPATKNSKPSELDATAAFRQRHADWLASLAYEVTGSGYTPPFVPSQMKGIAE